MARAPGSGGKTRLAAHLPASRLAALRRALLDDTLRTVAASALTTVVFYTPEEARQEMIALAPAATLVPQRGADLGSRMRHAIADLLSRDHVDAAMLVGTDLPLLTTRHLAAAADALQRGASMVLGPAADGGYYLIGVTERRDALFNGITWGSDRVLAETRARAAELGLDVQLMDSAYDVDTIDDLQRVERDLAVADASVAPALRAWFSAR